MRTVILGLGNPLLHDDGAGIEAVRLVQEGWTHNDGNLEFKTASVGGIRILDEITGFQRAIIVDALMTGKPAGMVTQMPVEALSGDLHASCIHDLSLQEALSLGRSLGMHLPEEIIIYGIEVADPYTLSEECSPAVQTGARQAAQRIRDFLMED